MGWQEPRGRPVQQTARSQLGADGLPRHLAAKHRSPLAADGHPARQRVCSHAHRSTGLRQDDLPAPTAAPAAATVLSGPPEPVEQVRQGDGADQQPAGEPRRARRHQLAPASDAEADAVEEQGERATHLRSLAGRPHPLRLVHGHHEQSASADGRYGQPPLHLPDHSQGTVHRQRGRHRLRPAVRPGALRGAGAEGTLLVRQRGGEAHPGNESGVHAEEGPGGNRGRLLPQAQGRRAGEGDEHHPDSRHHPQRVSLDSDDASDENRSGPHAESPRLRAS